MSVLSIVIGNTHIRAGIVDLAKRDCLFVTQIRTHKDLSGFDEILMRVLEHNPAQTCVCSVVKPVPPQVISALRRKGIDPTLFDRVQLRPFTSTYNPESSLGQDRAANISYARNCFPDAHVVVVDCGTAITVDLLRSDGTFAGGVIMPSPWLQLKALYANTDQLPALTDYRDFVFPGTSTAHCMKAGVTLGAAGAVERIIHEYMTIIGEPAIILVTGGGMEFMRHASSIGYIHIEHLTIIGAALYSFGSHSR